MSTLIIGKGLAGLITAIHIKERNPYHQVILMEKQFPQGNSYIAGQRIRAGIAKERNNPMGEILSLFKHRNGGTLTNCMYEFTHTLISEIEYWHSMGIPYKDSRNWFGPQWGNTTLSGAAKAYSVMDWFTKKAISLGVQLVVGEITSLCRKDNMIVKVYGTLQGDSVSIEAETYVLAGGSSTGLIFESTNRLINHTPHLLAHKAGIPLVGGSITMLHPFGMKNIDGRTLPGCLETDTLERTKVFDLNQNRLNNIEILLREHKAHYHFPAICKQIFESGSTIKILDEERGERYAGVGIHYNQLGVQTTDGVTVTGVNNVFAVGDASGVSHWTNGHERYPGIALGNCLVTGAKAARLIKQRAVRSKVVIAKSDRIINSDKYKESEELKQIRGLNAAYTIPLTLGLVHNPRKHIINWSQSLKVFTKVSRQDVEDVNRLSNVVIDQYMNATI